MFFSHVKNPGGPRIPSLRIRFEIGYFAPQQNGPGNRELVAIIVFFFGRLNVGKSHRVLSLRDSSLSFEARTGTPPKTNMTTENPPFEDVFPIEERHFPMSC